MRLRILLFLLCALLILGGCGLLNQGLLTLNRLGEVEAERDRWQRPGDVLRAMDLRPGDTAADLGSGAGYFTLKLASAVGPRGRVVAVDLRPLSLTFLWIRALLRSQHTVSVVRGDAQDALLPAGSVDAALICNTYHELADPRAVLANVARALKPGGRLVVVDPGGGDAQHHGADPAQAESAMRQSGLLPTARQDRFIDQPGEEAWWLIVAGKPN